MSNVSLGLPDNNLHGGDTWNIQLVGGADLGAANRMQTVATGASANGDVLLDGAGARVTSGTGHISIAAAHDFRINSNTGVVYTSGAPATDTVEGGFGRVDQDSFGLWAQGGGDISITAGHDAIGTSSEWITDWYRRTVSVAGIPGSWWTFRANFQDNIGALGGGNVTIAAGHDVNNLSAMIPTSGRVYSPQPLTIRQGRTTVLGRGRSSSMSKAVATSRSRRATTSSAASISSRSAAAASRRAGASAAVPTPRRRPSSTRWARATMRRARARASASRRAAPWPCRASTRRPR